MSEKPLQHEQFRSLTDCMGDSRDLIAILLRHIQDPEKSNAFWEAFEHKLSEAGDTELKKPDELRLLCTYKVYIEELFEEYDDDEGLALLEQLEEKCC